MMKLYIGQSLPIMALIIVPIPPTIRNTQPSVFILETNIFLTSLYIILFHCWSSKMNSSSILVFSALAILCANRSEGLYLPCSRKIMVSRLTPTICASFSWVSSRLARNSFILFSIFYTSFPVYQRRSENKYCKVPSQKARI